MTTPTTTPETLTAYLADHWHPGSLGLVLGPNTKNAGFTSLQVAGTPEQFMGAITMLKVARANKGGAEKASHTVAIKHLASAIVSHEAHAKSEECKARFAELTK